MVLLGLRQEIRLPVLASRAFQHSALELPLEFEGLSRLHAADILHASVQPAFLLSSAFGVMLNVSFGLTSANNFFYDRIGRCVLERSDNAKWNKLDRGRRSF